LVPAAGQRYFAAGKVTVGLSSQWPCVTKTSVVYSPTGSRPMSVSYIPHGVWHLYLTYPDVVMSMSVCVFVSVSEQIS